MTVTGGLSRPAIPAASRRSGRIPAEPYPPPRYWQYTLVCEKSLQEMASPRYNYPYPGSAPLAGFEVSTYGRFSDVHRGSPSRNSVSNILFPVEELIQYVARGARIHHWSGRPEPA